MRDKLELRKHQHQMTTTELDLLNLLTANRHYYLAGHCKAKLKERNINKKEIFEVLYDGKVIEYHYVNGSHRVLIRGNKISRADNVCIVVDFFENQIVTAYKNAFNDLHRTLDEEQYDRHLDILEMLKTNIPKYNVI